MINRAKSTTFLAIFCASSLFADTLKPNGCKGPNLCSSYPLTDGCSWQFDVGLLYQQMRISAAEVATAVILRDNGHIPPDAQAFVNITNSNVRFEFDVDAGLKLGVGRYFENNSWLFLANFEWLRSQANFSTIAHPPVHYLPSEFQTVWAENGSSTLINFQEVDASLAVDYFLLDVVLAKGSYFADPFSFEPFGGIQSTWLSYNTEKLFSDDAKSHLPANSAFSFITNVNFWGVGPEIGLNSAYYMMGGWSIYTTMNLAVLFGQTTLFNMNGIVTTLVDPTFNNTSDQNNVLCPTARTILGLQYERNIYCDKQHIRMRLGFDARYIFNQFPVVNYLAQYTYNHSYQPVFTAPSFEENNSFGMVGLILDVAYDF